MKMPLNLRNLFQAGSLLLALTLALTLAQPPRPPSSLLVGVSSYPALDTKLQLEGPRMTSP